MVSRTCLLMDKTIEDKRKAAIEERRRYQDPALFGSLAATPEVKKPTGWKVTLAAARAMQPTHPAAVGNGLVAALSAKYGNTLAIK